MITAEYSKIENAQLEILKAEIKEGEVITLKDELGNYGSDETEDFNFPPEAVVKAANVEEVAATCKFCNQYNIPLTTRGAGTGLSGGALPVKGGIVLSTEKLNRIIEIDEKNFQAIVEPGVINEVFQNALAEKNLFYPPDPASKGSSFLGGNLAENAGGPKALKYGATKDYVLNLEVVLAKGSIIWTGANTLKNATGYNLTQLIVGSEGTLGIITKAVFKLRTLPKTNVLMLAPFEEPGKACEAVAAIFQAGLDPSALEFMERDALEWSIKFSDSDYSLSESEQAHLLIELDGNDLDALFKDAEKVQEVLEQFGVQDLRFAESERDKEQLWKLRRKVGEAVHANSVYKEEDTVVPRAYLPELLKGVKGIGDKYGFKSVCYGHAGDGNLHVNIVKGDLGDDEWNVTVKEGIREIFKLVKSLGGTLSGEHGIGWVQREYMDVMFDKTQIDIMRSIKKVFDPNGILNPDKILPDEV